jgi:hypothetical protein
MKVKLGQPVIDHFHSDPISVSGATAHTIDVRLLGAIDMTGRAFKWTPYRWRPLKLRRGSWRGALPAPALLGTYQLELRLDGRNVLTSASWLERVFPDGTKTCRSFATPAALIRNYVAHLGGKQTLVAIKPWPLASYDHRDPRLNRLFVIAYAPRDDNRPSSRVGKFITTARDGFHGRWRLLQATTQPPD